MMKVKVEGQHVERRRREDRGDVGAEGVGFGEGVSPSPIGEGDTPSPMAQGSGVPLPRVFLIFCLGMLHFGCNLMHFQT